MLHIYIYDISSLRVNDLTLILLTWRKWWTPNNASKWQMGFNSAFKGLSVVNCFMVCMTAIQTKKSFTYTSLDKEWKTTPTFLIDTDLHFFICKFDLWVVNTEKAPPKAAVYLTWTFATITWLYALTLLVYRSVVNLDSFSFICTVMLRCLVSTGVWVNSAM